MLENSVTIVLAILSLVCVYLIWENFKQSSKIRYLESSIHETIQTVQGLVNNSLCLPPPRTNYHPEPVKQSLTAQSLQQSSSQSTPSKLKDIKEDHEHQEEHEEHEEQSEEEPFEMSDELKEKINNLTFNQDESDDEQIEELSFNGDNDNECDVECQDLPDDMTDTLNEPEEPEEVEEPQKVEEPEKVKEVKTVEPEPTSAPIEVKKVEEESQATPSDDYITNTHLLNEMSLKELREIAEKRNLGYRGTKEQLIMKIKRDISS
jgi:hypothetical protein